MIEQQLYSVVLFLAGIVNLVMAAILLQNSYYYKDYPTYRRARILTALCLAVFGIGFFMHHCYQWRFSWPYAATALTVTYFHLGGTLLGDSHTSLLNPAYLNRGVALRDTIAVASSIFIIWTGAFTNSIICIALGVSVFFIHIFYLVYTFYSTFFRVRNGLLEMQQGSVAQFVHWMLLSCHLIIGFGIGSIVFTALLPNAIWPYTLLLSVGLAVFIYIFYSLTEYGAVIDSATNATEDLAEKEIKSTRYEIPTTH